MTTRRRFLSLVAVASWGPPYASAQQSRRLPKVGILSPGVPIVFACKSDVQPFTVCFLMDGMRALGYVEGRNVAFEYRFADGDYKRLLPLRLSLSACDPT